MLDIINHIRIYYFPKFFGVLGHFTLILPSTYKRFESVANKVQLQPAYQIVPHLSKKSTEQGMSCAYFELLGHDQLLCLFLNFRNFILINDRENILNG